MGAWLMIVVACSPSKPEPIDPAPAAPPTTSAPPTPATSPPSTTPPTTTTPAMPIPSGYGSGTATYRETFDGLLRCDEAVDLTLAPDPIPTCPACVFSSEVTATSTRDVALIPGCGPWSTGWADEGDPTFGHTEVERHLRLGYTPSFADAIGTYPDALVRGYDVLDGYGGDDSVRDLWELWSWPAPTPAFALYPPISSYDGTQASSSLTLSTAWYANTDGWCSDDAADPTHGGRPAAGVVGQGVVACDGATTDVWSFDAVAGDPIALAVDVVDAAAGFDPHLLVLYDGCYLAFDDDTFDCTASMSPTGCPGMQLTAPYTGTYTAQIRAVGACAAGSGAYELVVDGPANPSLRAEPAFAGGAMYKYVREWVLDVTLDP